MGRPAIFIVSILQLINSLGLMLIYFIVLGDTSASFIKTIFFPESDNFFTTKICYILILGTALLYPLLLKELKEIKFVSFVLFIGIFSFVALMIF